MNGLKEIMDFVRGVHIDGWKAVRGKKGEISEIKHINSSQDSIVSGKPPASNRGQTADTKLKCAKCGVYKEVHGTIGNHDFIEEKNVTQ